MRIASRALSAILAASAVVLISACSGSGSSSSTSMMPGHVNEDGLRLTSVAKLTGFTPAFLPLQHLDKTVPRLNKQVGPLLNSWTLAVSDLVLDYAEVFNHKYQLTTTITNGFDAPDGDWYDGKGNLYVANLELDKQNVSNVQEYAKGGSSPIFTYSSGLDDGVNVTTDKAGNVYVADDSGGFVAEYPQGVNEMSAKCSPGDGVIDVVVDAAGHVFVSQSINDSSGGNIVEYKHGLAGCKATALGVKLGTAGGITIDRSGNLVACDEDAGVDVIPPPYKSISSTIASTCFDVSLTKNGDKIYISEPLKGDVLVTKYPSGEVVTTLGTDQGLVLPPGVAVHPVRM